MAGSCTPWRVADLRVSQLADELPRYEICKTKQEVAAECDPHSAPAHWKNTFADARSDRMDGLRLDWPGKWLLIRASNTEPIVRIVAETATAAESRQLCAEAAKVIARL